MAATAAAALLDELMGRDRNLAPTEQRREVRWEDPETCKYFLCAFCPHELFVNTRADLGPCDKIHDEELRKNYQKSSRFERMGYEEDFLRFLQSLLADVERRIKRGHARLALNNSQAGQNMNTAAANREEQVEILTKRINDLVEEAEQLGCEGKVEEAQGVMRLCEQLKEERGALEGTDKRDKQQADGDGIKKMDVCDVCGALLVAGDAQQRIDEHLMGKQHMGYARIRSYVDNRKKKLWGEESDREERINKEREEREKEREREKEERRKKLEEREKEREKEREEREREREKEREREQRRRRSRSRSRSRRSRSKSSTRSRRRSRSRDRRKRSRSRDRSRDRSRRHRSRSSSRSRSRRSSRSRGRRSRSRSRRRSRDRRDRSRSKDRRDKEDHKSRETDDQGSKGKDEHGSRDKDDYKSRSKDEHRSRERDDHKSRDKRDRSRDRDRDRDRKSRERDSYRSRDRDEKRSRDKDDHRSRDKESGRSRDQEDRRSREREDRRSGERDDYRSRDRDDKSDRGSRDEDTRRSEERDMHRDSHGSPDNDVDHRSRYREDEEDRIRDHKGSPDDDNWAGGKNEDISYKRSTNQEYSSSAGHGKWDSDEEDERMDMGNGGEDGYRMSGDRADDRLGGAAAPPSFADEVMDTQGDSN